MTLHAFHPSSGNHDVIGRGMAHYAVQVDLADLDRVDGRVWMMPSGRIAVAGSITKSLWRSYSVYVAGEWQERWANPDRVPAPIDDLANALARSAAIANTRVTKNKIGPTESGRLTRDDALTVEMLSTQTASLALNHPPSAIKAEEEVVGATESAASAPVPRQPVNVWLGSTEADTDERLGEVAREVMAEPVLVGSVPEDERRRGSGPVPDAIAAELDALGKSASFGNDALSRAIERQKEHDSSCAESWTQCNGCVWVRV